MSKPQISIQLSPQQQTDLANGKKVYANLKRENSLDSRIYQVEIKENADKELAVKALVPFSKQELQQFFFTSKYSVLPVPNDSKPAINALEKLKNIVAVFTTSELSNQQIRLLNI